MSEEVIPKVGPNASDAPESTPETANIFGYDVAANAGTVAPSKPNPASPLAAG
jgi:hypothetical protein